LCSKGQPAAAALSAGIALKASPSLTGYVWCVRSASALGSRWSCHAALRPELKTAKPAARPANSTARKVAGAILALVLLDLLSR
jgi:hypothetical protein